MDYSMILREVRHVRMISVNDDVTMELPAITSDTAGSSWTRPPKIKRKKSMVEFKIYNTQYLRIIIIRIKEITL